MQLTAVPIAVLGLLAAAAPAAASLHSWGYCTVGSWPDKTTTDCMCWNYKRRNKGSDWWNTCPDCAYGKIGVNHDVEACLSPASHLGGDEMYYYCTSICGANGSIGS